MIPCSRVWLAISIPASRGAVTSTVLWPTLLGLSFLAAGLVTYRRDVRTLAPNEALGLVAFGPAFVARRYIRWSTIGLAVMFGLFVLLMDIPGAIARPAPLNSMLAARQATFAIGALALFATATKSRSPQLSRTLATIARIWTAIVLVAYGIQHLVHPEYTPGVPSPVPTAAWVPLRT